MRALIEIDQVAKVQPQSNRPECRCYASARIDRAIHIGISNPKHRARHTAVGNQARAQSKINEPSLQRDEWPKVSVRSLQFRPEQPFSNSDRSLLNRLQVSVRDVVV